MRLRIALGLALSVSSLAAQPSPILNDRIPWDRAEAAAFVAEARNVVLPIEARIIDEGLSALQLHLAREPRPPGRAADDIWDWLPGKTLAYAIMVGRSDLRARQQRAINETHDALQKLKAQAAAETDLDRKDRLLAQAVRTRETLRILVADRDRADPEVEAYYAKIKASRPMPTPTSAYLKDLPAQTSP